MTESWQLHRYCAGDIAAHDGKKVEDSESSWTPTLTESGRVRSPQGCRHWYLQLVIYHFRVQIQ